MKTWLAGFFALIAFVLFVRMYGQSQYSAGYAAAELAQSQAVVKESEHREDTKQKVMRYDDAELIHSMCKWVYDIPYDQCVRTYKFIP